MGFNQWDKGPRHEIVSKKRDIIFERLSEKDICHTQIWLTDFEMSLFLPPPYLQEGVEYCRIFQPIFVMYIELHQPRCSPVYPSTLLHPRPSFAWSEGFHFKVGRGLEAGWRAALQENSTDPHRSLCRTCVLMFNRYGGVGGVLLWLKKLCEIW